MLRTCADCGWPYDPKALPAHLRQLSRCEKHAVERDRTNRDYKNRRNRQTGRNLSSVKRAMKACTDAATCCQSCGAPKGVVRLEAHKPGGGRHYADSSYVALCPSCHRKQDARGF